MSAKCCHLCPSICLKVGSPFCFPVDSCWNEKPKVKGVVGHPESASTNSWGGGIVCPRCLRNAETIRRSGNVMECPDVGQFPSGFPGRGGSRRLGWRVDHMLALLALELEAWPGALCNFPKGCGSGSGLPCQQEGSRLKFENWVAVLWAHP